MTKTYYVFRDFSGYTVALFDDEAALNAFLKEYISQFIEDTGEMPVESEDYTIVKGMLNPSHDEWYNED